MNLNQLRVFAAVAANQSITRAARQLTISQPAVSKQLAELEEALGVVLFDRLPRGMRLTEAGELLEQHVVRILAEEEAAEAGLAALRGLARGRLRVGASTTIGSYLAPSMLGELHRLHPTIKLELVIGNTTAIHDALVEHRLDVGLTEGFVGNEQLEAEVIGSDELVVIVSPTHALRRRAPLAAADLASAPYLTREVGSGSRDVVDAALAELGVTVKPELSLGSTEALKNAVAAGLGYAIVSRLAVELELRFGVLTVLEVAQLRIERPLHLVQLRGRTPSRAVTRFVELLRKRVSRSGGPQDFSI